MYLGARLVTRGVLLGIIVLVIFASIVTNSASLPSTSYASSESLQNSDSNSLTNGGQNVEKQAVSPDACRISDKYPHDILQWCDLITRYAEKHEFAPDLIAALIWQESGGKPMAYSKSGAVGLMQVMPRDGTASTFMCINGPCFANRPSINELQDPEFNVKYGTRMLARLVNENGNLRDALRAYGPKDVGYYYADKVIGIYQTYGA